MKTNLQLIMLMIDINLNPPPQKKPPEIHTFPGLIINPYNGILPI